MPAKRTGPSVAEVRERARGGGAWPPGIATGPAANLPLEGHDKDQGTIFQIVFNEATNELVTASADHSLRVWDIATASCKRELFKQGGHHEWVTTCAALGDGSVVSAGMDNQILFWGRGSQKSQQLGLHESCSKLAAYGASQVASIGYDGCLRIWGGGAAQEVKVDSVGLTALSITPQGEFAVGSREGTVALIGKDYRPIFIRERVHGPKAVVTTVSGCPLGAKDAMISGGGDGKVAVWRDGNVAWCSPQQKVSISYAAYECGPHGAKPRVVFTCGCEIHVCPLTAKANWKVLNTHKGAITEALLLDKILLTGDTEGQLVATRLGADTTSGDAETLWGFGALRRAIRTIAVSADRRSVAVGGEEAVGMLLKFE